MTETQASPSPASLAAKLLTDIEDSGMDREALAEELGVQPSMIENWIAHSSVPPSRRKAVALIARGQNLNDQADTLDDSITEASIPRLATNVLDKIIGHNEGSPDDLAGELDGPYLKWQEYGYVPVPTWPKVIATAEAFNTAAEVTDSGIDIPTASLTASLDTSRADLPSDLCVVLRNVERREGEVETAALLKAKPEIIQNIWFKRDVPIAHRKNVITALEGQDLSITERKFLIREKTIGDVLNELLGTEITMDQRRLSELCRAARIDRTAFIRTLKDPKGTEAILDKNIYPILQAVEDIKSGLTPPETIAPQAREDFVVKVLQRSYALTLEEEDMLRRAMNDPEFRETLESPAAFLDTVATTEGWVDTARMGMPRVNIDSKALEDMISKPVSFLRLRGMIADLTRERMSTGENSHLVSYITGDQATAFKIGAILHNLGRLGFTPESVGFSSTTSTASGATIFSGTRAFLRDEIRQASQGDREVGGV